MEEGKNVIVKTEGYKTSEPSFRYIYKHYKPVLPLFQPLALSSFCCSQQEKRIGQAKLSIIVLHRFGMEWAMVRGKVLRENENSMEEPSQTSIVERKFITKFTITLDSNVFKVTEEEVETNIPGNLCKLCLLYLSEHCCQSLLFSFFFLVFLFFPLFFLPFSHLGFHPVDPGFLGRPSPWDIFLRYIVHLWSEPHH